MNKSALKEALRQSNQPRNSCSQSHPPILPYYVVVIETPEGELAYNLREFDMIGKHTSMGEILKLATELVHNTPVYKLPDPYSLLNVIRNAYHERWVHGHAEPKYIAIYPNVGDITIMTETDINIGVGSINS